MKLYTVSFLFMSPALLVSVKSSSNQKRAPGQFPSNQKEAPGLPQAPRCWLLEDFWWAVLTFPPLRLCCSNVQTSRVSLEPNYSARAIPSEPNSSACAIFQAKPKSSTGEINRKQTVLATRGPTRFASSTEQMLAASLELWEASIWSNNLFRNVSD